MVMGKYLRRSDDGDCRELVPATASDLKAVAHSTAEKTLKATDSFYIRSSLGNMGHCYGYLCTFECSEPESGLSELDIPDWKHHNLPNLKVGSGGVTTDPGFKSYLRNNQPHPPTVAIATPLLAGHAALPHQRLGPPSSSLEYTKRRRFGPDHETTSLYC
ncbi:hypothetical protein Acr_10g0002900 [Actinidia rufa]|uniref:Uncharacterized protein n=1 Tax=Actinidia rufa TaxID=165716 RepID=A0A7J0F895_9ERIC|nr:hypothetical protein Acr_10g0002900 [Actinidia rufa]